MRKGIIISPDYRGTESGKTAYFGIDSNIPYWTATLVTQERMWERQLPMISRLNPEMMPYIRSHGSNTQNIPIYMSNAKKVLHPVRLE